MAVIVVLMASIAGFVGAAIGWLFLGLPLVSALAIWALSGPLSVLLLLVSRALRADPARTDEATAWSSSAQV